MARKQNLTVTQIAKKIQNLAKTAVISFEREFNDIIDSRCREEYRIEHALDGMLNFCFDKNILEMYRKLCKYYYNIDQKSATGYVYAYRDMYDPKGTEKMPRICWNYKMEANSK